MIETAVVVALISMIGNIVCIIISSKNATNTAIINSNARAAQTEQKFTDAIEQVQKEQVEIKKRLDELSETDSCCVLLKDDVAQIKEDITVMAASINQLKAESSQSNAVFMRTNMLMLRHTINEGHRIFTTVGKIDKNTKQSLLDLGDIYTLDYKGNSFAGGELADIKKIPLDDE